MIVVKIIGGLGNQLFQYACGYNLARYLNTDLKIDISEFEKYKLHNFTLNKFNISAKYASKKDLEGLNIFKEKTLNFDSEVFNCDTNSYLDGYWASEKYFIKSKKNLINEFKVLNNLEDMNLEFSKLIENSNSVSLHIRRGDYVPNSYKEQLLEICDLDYYKRSIDYFKQKGEDYTFFIFTDDKKWVRDNFKINDFKYYFIEHNDADLNYEDFRLMSLCKHNIIANSTFSWWASWLNLNTTKIIIAPKKWHTQKIKTKIKDLIPDEWIKL